MDFSELYFGKTLDSLSYQDIEEFFREEKEESNRIEFKSFVAGHSHVDKDIKNVMKGICALLNAEGGILIWVHPKEGK